MRDIDDEIVAALEEQGVKPLIGGLIPEPATAGLLGYSVSHWRAQAAKGLAPLPHVLRGNRRFYRITDIKRFVTETQ